VERLPCTHKGTYADDCICERVKQHRCYIVATCDRDLRRRIRKIPGVPIMYIQSHRWERFPARHRQTGSAGCAAARCASVLDWAASEGWRQPARLARSLRSRLGVCVHTLLTPSLSLF
jgi:hypothetical protein